MSHSSHPYQLDQSQREQILSELRTLLKERSSLQHILRQQQDQAATDNESLFLELLEVSDALESLLNYLQANTTEVPPAWSRLPQSLASVQKKLLAVLAKRDVRSIALPDNQLDLKVCQVVDREYRPDLAEQTITKIIRHGFYLGSKLLRPIEVIISRSKD